MANGDSTNELLDDEGGLQHINRRTLLRLGFLGSLAALGVAAIGAFLRFFYPRDDAPPYYAELDLTALPRPGDAPVDHLFLLPDGSAEAKLYLVNLRADEGLWQHSDHTPGGLIAFWRKCPHDACSVAWRPNQQWQGEGTTGTGVFVCPCCEATFTKSGVSVFGPTPRSMDTFAIELHSNTLRIHIAKARKGSPQHAPPDPAMFVSVPT